MTKKTPKKSPVANVAVSAAKPARGRYSAFFPEVRKLLSGEGMKIEDLCQKLKIDDRFARGIIDALRNKEGGTGPENADRRFKVLPKVGPQKFAYKGLDGKGI